MIEITKFAAVLCDGLPAETATETRIRSRQGFE